MKHAFLSIWLLAAATLPAAAQESWSSLPWTPAGFAWHGAGSVNGRVYIIGGYDYGYNRFTYEYDPIGNTWTSRGDLPVALWSMSIAVVNGTIYSIGGGDASDQPRTDVYAFDVAAGTWSGPRAPMPTGRLCAAVGVVNDRIYVCGGMTDYYDFATVLSTVEEYDPATDQWRSVASMPFAAAASYFGAIGGQVVVAGGLIDDGTSTNRTAGYDPARNQWTDFANMPANGCQGASAVYRERLYAISGTQLGAQNAEFSIHANRWTQRAQLSIGMEFGAAAMAGNKNYITCGGYHYVYTPPDFGADPAASGAVQCLADGTPLPIGSTAGVGDLLLKATIADADGAADSVRLEVEVRDAAEPFTNLPTTVGPWTPPGPATVTIPSLTAGDYKWRVRPADLAGNVGPWIAQSAGTCFTIDTAGPSMPDPIAPGDGSEVGVLAPFIGPVGFSWSDGGDDSGLPSASYEIRVVALGSQLPGGPIVLPVAGTSTAIPLAVSADSYRWSVRAMDPYGNWGAWSIERSFRVVFDDRIDHGAGDAKLCGQSATGSSGTWVVLVIVLAAVLRGRN